MRPATATVVHVPAKAPFDFAYSLAFLGRFPAMTGEQELSANALSYALRANGRTVGVTARPAAGGLEIALEGAGLDDHAVEVAIDRVSFFLGLDDDVAAFYALAAGDRAFEAVIDRMRGYHHVKFPSPLELLVWAILGQRVPMSVARKMKHAVIEHFDNRVTIGATAHVAFPDFEQLAALDTDGWAALIVNRRKAAYLAGAVRGFGELGEAYLRHGDEGEVREALLALPGIGPWSTSFLMIRGLGRMGSLPPDREGLRAASRVYGHDVSEAEFVALADRYGAWKGYWGHYLRTGS